MDKYNDLQTFRFWCMKILPLVYDDSLSYYEVLCKVVDYINKLIEDDKTMIADIQQLQSEMQVVQKWIADFDTSYAESIVNDYLTKALKTVTFGISQSGYFVADIPQNWKDIQFGTIQEGKLYGHLTLQYE